MSGSAPSARQRKAIGKQIRAFERAATWAKTTGPPKGVHPEIHKSMIAALNKEILALELLLSEKHES